MIALKAQLRRINTGLLPLVICFFAGVLLGTICGGVTMPLQIVSSGDGNGLLTSLWLPVLVLLLGTSTMGHRVIPLLMLLRGYLLSASFAIFLCSGVRTDTAFFVIGLPAVFSVPAFFLLCEDAVSASRIICLCSECNLIRNCGYIQPGRLILSASLLLAAAALQIYFLPLIV